MTFRTDIATLRTIAVTLVIFYHFNIPGFSGGLIGVDIFFVISGYLMSRIILNKLSKDSFSVLDFLKRRIQRLVPALLLLTTVLFFLSFLLIKSDQEILGRHVLTPIKQE